MIMISNRKVPGLVLASLLVSGAVASAQAPVGAQPPPRTQPIVRDTLVGVASGISFGVRTGVAVAKLSSDQESTTQGRIAPTAGIYLEARLGRLMTLVMDALYTEYGGNEVNPVGFYGKDSIAGHKVERTNLQAQAIEVPLQLKLRPSLSSPIVPYVSLGASRTWFLGTVSDNYVTSDDPDARTLEVGVNMDRVVHKTDFAGLGAVGIEVRGTRLRWSVEVFSRFGLTDFNKPQVAGMNGYTAGATGVKVGIGR
jgi:hypothetical protein